MALCKSYKIKSEYLLVENAEYASGGIIYISLFFLHAIPEHPMSRSYLCECQVIWYCLSAQLGYYQ